MSSNRSFDVVVVGGGIAGSSLSAVLSRAGLSIALIEHEPRFRDRMRGESLHPWGAAEVRRLRLGVLLDNAGAQSLPIWQTYVNRTPQDPYRWTDDSIDGQPEYGVSHPKLQVAAWDAAIAAGVAPFRPAKAIAVRRGTRAEVDIDFGDRVETLIADIVVGADGRTSQVRKRIGASELRDPIHHRFGGALLAEVDLAPDTTHAASFPGGRAYVLPQGGGIARVYFVTHPDLHTDVQADRTGLLIVESVRALLPPGGLDRAIVTGSVGFFPNADRWSSSLFSENVVLIGDAAGANDPSVGQGLSLVFRDVRELSGLLLNEPNKQVAIQEFGRRRSHYYEVVRLHARWFARLSTEIGPEADATRERFAKAREADPSAGGYSMIFSRGPDELETGEAARKRFFGEA